MTLDDSNSIPLYLQLKNTIKDLINRNEIQQGEKILSEYELCKKYNVSRITVRNALSELEAEGYLIKKQGKGTFAAKPRIFRPLEDTISFTESCKNAGLESTSIILKKQILPLKEPYREDLHLEKNDKILFIQRLRFAGGEPLMLENNYFSYNRFSFLLDEPLTGSLYDLLAEKKEIICDRALKGLITVTAAHGECAKLLQVPMGTPLFVMDSVMGDNQDRPVHSSAQYIVGEKYSFVRKVRKSV